MGVFVSEAACAVAVHPSGGQAASAWDDDVQERWDSLEPSIMALLGDVAGKKLPMFAAFPDVERKDLKQAAFVAIHRAFPTFDPALGKISTWVHMVGGRALISLHRTRSASARREGIVAGEIDGLDDRDADADGEAVPEVNGAFLVTLEDRADSMPAKVRTSMVVEITPPPAPLPPLADWLRSVYARAKTACPDGPQREGRPKSFTKPQKAAIAALVAARNLSVRGCQDLLRQRADLRQALRLERMPSHMTIARAASFVTENKRRRILKAARAAANTSACPPPNPNQTPAPRP